MRLRRLRAENAADAAEQEGFAEWLLKVGDGEITTIPDTEDFQLPDDMIIPHADGCVQPLIDFVYPNLEEHTGDASYFMDRGILAPKNVDVHMLNDKLLAIIPGNHQDLFSADSIDPQTENAAALRNLYPQEFLHALNPSNLPPHHLKLKVGVPIILLRTTDRKMGLCNGTRLIVRGFSRNVIDAEVLTGTARGARVFIPRITITTDKDYPFIFSRRQFPVRLAFAISINKSQGQIMDRVGIYLNDPVFSHGQLYVALSRVTSKTGIKVYLGVGEQGRAGYTRNVVYKEILL